MAKYYSLGKLQAFLKGLKMYNLCFTDISEKVKSGEKEGFFSLKRYLSILNGLSQKTYWGAVNVVHSNASVNIDKIKEQWFELVRRSLLSTDNIQMLFNAQALLTLQRLAKQAISQLKWRMLGGTQELKQICEQFIQALEPYASAEKQVKEKLKLSQDALARLTISIESKDTRHDDVCYHVAHKINAAVPLTSFFSDKDAEASTGDETINRPIHKMNNEEKKRVAKEFLSKPHYNGMTPKSFSNLINIVETYGENAEKSTLYQFKIFDEDYGNLKTINRDLGQNRLVIPKDLGAFIPKFSFLPSLFKDIASRFAFFKDKHWLIHIMKEGIQKYLAPSHEDLMNADSFQRILVLEKFIKEEIDEIQSRMTSLKSWHQKSRKLLTEWKGMVSTVHSDLVAFKKPYEESPAQEAIIVQSEQNFENILPNNSKNTPIFSKKEKRKPTEISFSVVEKRILNACTQIYQATSCDSLDVTLFDDVLNTFYQAYFLEEDETPASSFHRACRKEANEMFKYIAIHFENSSKKDLTALGDLDLQNIFSQLDLFAKVVKVIRKHPRKSFSEAQYRRFETIGEQAFMNQLISICKSVESLTKDHQFRMDAILPHQRLLEAIKKYAQSYEIHAPIVQDCEFLLEKKLSDCNRNIIEARFSSVREMIEERKALLHEKISNLQPGTLYSPRTCRAQSLITNPSNINNETQECVL